jgi:hypothetical protein
MGLTLTNRKLCHTDNPFMSFFRSDVYIMIHYSRNIEIILIIYSIHSCCGPLVAVCKAIPICAIIV